MILLKKKLEKEIGRLFPDKFNSVYEQVSFTNGDYTTAWRRQKAQDVFMENILLIDEFKIIPFTANALEQLNILLDEYQLEIDKQSTA